MKFIAPLLLFFLLSGNALVAQKDTSSLSSGVNLVGGAYFSAGDAVAGIQIGGELFFGWKKWQAEAQGFGKFRNDKPDYQLTALFGRRTKTIGKLSAVFTAGIGCELEDRVITTPIYGNYGFLAGTKTTYIKGEYWGVKMQTEFFQHTSAFTVGEFLNFFAGNDYQDVELGVILTLGKN
jgi:hypothetical protein